MPDGRVWNVPFAKTYAVIYDPVTDTLSSKYDAFFAGATKFIGAVLMPDGRVWHVPYTNTYAVIYDLGCSYAAAPARILSAYDNKF